MVSGPFLLVTGHVRTQDPERPVAEAVAVAGSRIVAVGDLASVRRRLPAGTPVLDAPFVAPGFVDSHVHVLWAGRAATRLALSSAAGAAGAMSATGGAAGASLSASGIAGASPSAGGVVGAVARFAAAHPDREWIEADFHGDGPLPSAAELESAAPGVGVVIDIKGHDALVNETALRRAGIGADTPDPPGGRIERSGDGVATGLLVEHPAVALVRAVMPDATDADRAEWIRVAQSELVRHGITTAVDPAVDAGGLRAYSDLGKTGELTARIVAMPHGVASPAVHETSRLRLGPTKIFLDGGGSLGTALLSTPWPGTDGYHGNQTVSRDELVAAVRAAPRGVGVHAVGDAAIDLVLDVIAAVRPAAPCHLIHAYLGPSAAAMTRARELGVAVSAHPALQWDFGAGLIGRLGHPRAAAANPLRSWLDAGVLVGGGSDAPGPPMSVLHGMWQARTRRVHDVDLPLGPEQAITAAEAFDLFTAGAAAVAGFGSTGRIRVGDPADLVALTVDPLTPVADELRTGRVLATIVDGVVRYSE